MTIIQYDKYGYREREIVNKLSELFGRLDSSSKTLEEKFSIFRSYFRGMQDGMFITLRSLDVEPTSHERPITELRIDILIDNVDNGRRDVESVWDDLDRELPLSRLLSTLEKAKRNN